jgi:hypothetical protein
MHHATHNLFEYDKANAQDLVPRVKLWQFSVIHYLPCPSLLLHIQDKLEFVSNPYGIQEIMRYICYCHMDLPPSARQVKNLQHLTTQLDFTLHSALISDIKGMSKYAKAIFTLQSLQIINLS